MGIHTLIPVQKALHVNLVADFQRFYCIVNLSAAVAQVRFYGEVIGTAIQRNIEIQIITLLAGAIPAVQTSHVVSIFLLSGGLNGHTLKGHKLILMVNQIVRT